MNLMLYILSFVVIWLISELIIKQSQKLSNILKFDTFVVSFFILGFMTTVPEISIGVNAIIENRPSIFVGNLLGEISLLFLFTIPLLAIVGKNIKLEEKYTGKPLLITLLVVILPYILTLNGVISLIDIILIFITYIFMAIVLLKNGKEKQEKVVLSKEDWKNILEAISVLIVSIVVIMFVGNYIVDTTIVYAKDLGVPAIIISMFAISIGTILPELVVGIRSVRAGKNLIAYGNYLGSASANSLVLVLLTASNMVVNKGAVVIDSNLIALIIILFGFLLFYLFQRSKHELSRVEGIVLLLIYIVFAVSQFVIAV